MGASYWSKGLNKGNIVTVPAYCIRLDLPGDRREVGKSWTDGAFRLGLAFLPQIALIEELQRGKQRNNCSRISAKRPRLLRIPAPVGKVILEESVLLRPSVRSFTITTMTTHDFKVFLEPDAQYGGYVVVCPSLPGCYSQGKSVSEALANIREAIELVLEDMESRGEELPDPSEVLVGSVVVTR